MEFDVINAWALLALRVAVTTAGIVVLVWLGWVWREMQTFGLGGLLLGVLAVIACLGGIGTAALIGLSDGSDARVMALERRLDAERRQRAQLAEQVNLQTDQLVALQQSVDDNAPQPQDLAGPARLVIKGADSGAVKSGWILTYLKEDGSVDPDTFEFVATRKPDAPLTAIKPLVGQDMWQRIQDGKVKAERGMIIEANRQTN